MNKVLTVLKNVGKFILKAFKWLFSDWKRLLIIVLTIFSIILFFNYKSVKHKYDNAIIENNTQIETYENKLGELYAENTAYITDIKNLKKSNSDLYNEIKSLKDNPIVVTKVETIIKRDTILINNNIVSKTDSTYNIKFNTSDEWFNIDGITSLNTKYMKSSTTINNVAFYSTIYTDFIEDGKDLRIITKSDNPYLLINNIEGAIISPEQSKILKKRYNKPWGIMFGIGASTTVYDGKVIIYPSINLTVGYKFISF